MNKRIIGIDLAVTATHKAVVFDTLKDEFVSNPLTFRANPAELERLWKRTMKDASPQTKVVVILEATHMSWYPVGMFFHLKGATVYRVNGQKTKDLRTVHHKHAGSDRIDCRVLVNLYRTLGDKLRPWHPETGSQLALQRACRRYAMWRELDVAHQNRLLALDQWAWGGLHKVVPTTARTWMRRCWYNPWRVVEAGTTYLTARWHAVAPGKEDDWIAGWVTRAQQRTHLYQSQQWAGFDHLQVDVTELLDERDFFLQKCVAISQSSVLPLYHSLYPNDPLPSIYGVGDNSAAIYHAFIHNIDRFPKVASFRRWTGLVPGSHQSGDHQAKGVPITQAGPALVRATLYLNANVARQWDVQLADIYYRQMVHYGKHHTQAVCAVASHLANRIYVLLKEQRLFELRGLDGNPISPEDSRHLCLTRFRVPDAVRQRSAVRTRRRKREDSTEKRYRRKQLRR